MPELRVAGVDIEVSAAAKSAEEGLDRQVAADVDEQIGGACHFKQFLFVEPDGLSSAFVDQRRFFSQREVPSHFLEILGVYAVAKWTNLSRCVPAGVAADLLHEVDLAP